MIDLCPGHDHTGECDLIIYAIVGAGGYGREVIPLVKEALQSAGTTDVQVLFVDDGEVPATINGYEVVSSEAFAQRAAQKKFFNVAIADSKVRERVVEKMLALGAEPFMVKAGNVVMLDANEVAEGAVLCPFTTITSNATIGKYFHANIYAYVAHDCVIGDYVTFAPAVKCNGNVVIEDHVYVGTGAIIKQGRAGKPLRIGQGAVVGMGAVVTKDVAPGAVVVGNPAKPLARKGLGG